MEILQYLRNLQEVLQYLPQWLVEARSGTANIRTPSPHVYTNNLVEKNAAALHKLFRSNSPLIQVLKELEHHMIEVDPLAVSSVKKLIPACCRIGGTMFTSCAFIGWMKGGGFTGDHTDDKNLLTIFYFFSILKSLILTKNKLVVNL